MKMNINFVFRCDFFRVLCFPFYSFMFSTRHFSYPQNSTVHRTVHCTVHITVHRTVHSPHYISQNSTVHRTVQITLHSTVHRTVHCTIHRTVHCTIHRTVHGTVHYIVQYSSQNSTLFSTHQIWICTVCFLVRNNLINQKANHADPDQMAHMCRLI
jgi:hypothetical protein